MGLRAATWRWWPCARTSPRPIRRNFRTRKTYWMIYYSERVQTFIKVKIKVAWGKVWRDGFPAAPSLVDPLDSSSFSQTDVACAK